MSKELSAKKNIKLQTNNRRFVRLFRRTGTLVNIIMGAGLTKVVGPGTMTVYGWVVVAVVAAIVVAATVSVVVWVTSNNSEAVAVEPEPADALPSDQSVLDEPDVDQPQQDEEQEEETVTLTLQNAESGTVLYPFYFKENSTYYLNEGGLSALSLQIAALFDGAVVDKVYVNAEGKAFVQYTESESGMNRFAVAGTAVLGDSVFVYTNDAITSSDPAQYSGSWSYRFNNILETTEITVLFS